MEDELELGYELRKEEALKITKEFEIADNLEEKQ
jgi:hypothetical protein